MPIPAGYFYDEGFYWATADNTGPYGWNGAAMYLIGEGGGGGVGLNVGQTISAVGVGANIATLGATRVSLSFSTEVGSVFQAHVMLENAATGAIIGVVYWPSTGPRWFDVPVGVANFRFNTTHWSDAGGTDNIALTVAG